MLNSYLYIIQCLMNCLMSDVKLVNLFSRYSKISERSKTEMQVLGHEFARERQNIGNIFKVQTVRLDNLFLT